MQRYLTDKTGLEHILLPTCTFEAIIVIIYLSFTYKQFCCRKQDYFVHRISKRIDTRGQQYLLRNTQKNVECYQHFFIA